MTSSLKKIKPFWYIIFFLIVLFSIIYGNHLVTHNTPSRVAITLPFIDLKIYWYGILIVGGIMLGAFAVSFEAQERGLDEDHIWGGLTWAIVLAVIGARLYHVLTPPPSMCEQNGICSAIDYFRHPKMLIDIRSGGLGIYGAIVGALIGIYLYGRRYKIDWLAYADIGVFGLALGQFVGRWGNFFNQELYGKPTNLPWAVYIQYPLSEYAGNHFFHPAFLYESLWNLFTFLVLYTVATRFRKKLLRGELLGLYLIMYPVGRIIMETIRLDSPTFIFNGQDTGLNIASVLAALVALLVAAFMIIRRRKATGETPA
ncbi:MAG: prolipoprotein diacylglyceryl transferase [Anaerolineales bacterium]|nr:prolipoprotein diacylglyceryl transferase [Anaerolineales bacterium]